MAAIKDLKVNKNEVIKLDNIKVWIIDRQMPSKQQIEENKNKMLIRRPKSHMKWVIFIVIYKS